MWNDTKCGKGLDVRMARKLHDPDGIKARMKAIRLCFGAKMGFRNQTEFAAWVGISRNAWSNYEAAGWRPRLDEAQKVVALTGVTLDWIYTGDERFLPVHLANDLRAALAADQGGAEPPAHIPAPRRA